MLDTSTLSRDEKDNNNINNTLSSSQLLEESLLPKYKILIIGDPGIGKTSLIYRFVDNFWEDNFIPIAGVDFVRNNKIIYFYRN